MFEYNAWMSYTWEWNGGVHQIDPLSIVPIPDGDGTIELYNLLGMTKQQALEISTPWRLLQVRKERDKRIAETDWWMLPDISPTQQQISYRQALRDITNNFNPELAVSWPVKPQ